MKISYKVYENILQNIKYICDIINHPEPGHPAKMNLAFDGLKECKTIKCFALFFIVLVYSSVNFVLSVFFTGTYICA